MRIPEAKDNVRKIAPNVGGIQPIAPIAAETDSAKAGLAMKESLQNAMEGFTRLYVADQRADAIKNFNDYKLALEEYRDSAQIDPTTGQPVGFTQLKGDQVTEDALKSAQDKVQAARAKLDKSMSGFISDLRDEFGMRADEAQASFDTATNAHFLKAKYEKAKTNADLDNENIVKNTIVSPQDTGKINQVYNSLYNNYYSYLQDENAAKRQAKAGVENIIKNNVEMIKQQGEDNSYDTARAYLNSPAIRKNLSEASYNALVHDVDLDSVKWQMQYPDKDTAGIQSYIKKHTSHLTPREKAIFIAAAQKRDIAKAGGAGAKKVSTWFEMFSRVANGQPDYFSKPNEFGIYVNQPVSEAEARQFQANFLTFGKSLLGAINNTPYNEEAIRKDGLKAILPAEQLKLYTSAQVGPLMKQAVKQIDYALKVGALELLDQTQTNSLHTEIQRIQEGNYNLGKLREQRIALENKLTEVNDGLKTNPTPEGINEAITYLRQYENIAGQIVVGFDDTTFIKTKRELMSKITGNMINSYENKMGLGEKLVSKVTGAVGAVRSWGDVWAFKGQMTEAQVNKNNQLISRWNKIAHTQGKNEDGTTSILPEAYKILRSAAWEMMNGDGLTVYSVRDDGTVDTQTAEKKKAFAMDDYRDNGIDPCNSDNVIYDTISQFMGSLNSKYKTNKFNDFRTLDFDALSFEDKRAFQEMLSRNWMKANGFPNKTFAPTMPFAYSDDIPYEPDVFTPTGIIPKLQEAMQPYIGPLDANVNDLRVMDFAGGVSSNEDIATLLQAGYSDFEDYSLQQILENKDENLQFQKSEVLHTMLNSLAPDGVRTKFIDPSDSKTKQYYAVKENVMKSGYNLQSDKLKQNRMEQVHMEELRLLSEIIGGLQKDNPDMKWSDFLTPGIVSYEVSDDTWNKALERYKKLRKNRVEVKKDMYMVLGAVAPSADQLLYWQKQGEDK